MSSPVFSLQSEGRLLFRAVSGETVNPRTLRETGQGILEPAKQGRSEVGRLDMWIHLKPRFSV